MVYHAVFNIDTIFLIVISDMQLESVKSMLFIKFCLLIHALHLENQSLDEAGQLFN